MKINDIWNDRQCRIVLGMFMLAVAFIAIVGLTR
jgi:hypothetical protein